MWPLDWDIQALCRRVGLPVGREAFLEDEKEKEDEDKDKDGGKDKDKVEEQKEPALEGSWQFTFQRRRTHLGW